MTAVDWEAYQACPVCPALLGKPCLALSGYVARVEGDQMVRAEASKPHTGRKLRAGR